MMNPSVRMVPWNRDGFKVVCHASELQRLTNCVAVCRLDCAQSPHSTDAIRCSAYRIIAPSGAPV
jgi:hypothetical protein